MSKKNRKQKTLVVAYACEPNKTSEPGVGWNFSKQIALFSNVTILTRLNNKESIEKEKSNINFIYYDLSKPFLYLKKILPLGTQLYYFFWQIGAYNYLRKYIRKNKIDILHHLNFGISWNPPPFFMIKLPIIWGPVGGADYVPSRFLFNMGPKAIFIESLYFISSFVSRIFNLFFLSKNKLMVLILRTKSAQKIFKKNNYSKTTVISETATDDFSNSFINVKKSINKLHAVCIGRMNYWKGFIFAVKGFHNYLLRGGSGKLELYGEGPELNKIKSYIKKNDLGQSIKIMGFVSNKKIKKVLLEANVLIHPSFRDGGSWSIMESMANGLPVVCLNTSGPKDMVTNRCGILVKIDTENQIVNDIGNGLLRLNQNPKLYKYLSKNAYHRIANEYNWKKRGKQIETIYKSLPYNFK